MNVTHNNIQFIAPINTNKWILKGHFKRHDMIFIANILEPVIFALPHKKVPNYLYLNILATLPTFDDNLQNESAYM